MDYKAIEAALALCEERMREYGESINRPHEFDYRQRLFSAESALVDAYSTDILRIVRAMGWMEEHKAELVMWGDKWVCQGIGWEDVPYTGPTIIDAIEAAMEQTKGGDESP